MAATNYTPIQLYFSTTASAVPLAANLAQGELAINITDGKLYYEDNGGVVQVIATKGAGTIGGSTTQIQYNNAGALAGNAAMVFNNSTNVTTLTTLNLTNALGAVYGGTAQSAYTQGDVLYASATNTLSKLGIGTVNYILTSSGSVPQWSAPSSISVLTATNLAGGVAGSVPYQSALDTTTFLAIGAANRVMTSTGSAPQWVTSLTGLTGVSSSSITNTSLASGRVVYSGASGVQTDSASLTFNGTTLSAGGFSTTGLSTLVQTVKIGDSNFNGVAVFAPATPAKLYMGTGIVTDVTSAVSATNTTGAIASLAITPIAATNTGVTYTNASTLYIAGAPSAGTNITITNPYALYVAAGASYLGGAVTIGGNTAVTGTLSATGITTLSAATTPLLLSGAGSSSTTLATNYAIRINAAATAANYGGIFFDGSTVYDSFFGRVPTALSGINDGVGYVTYALGAPTLRTLFSSTGLAVTGTMSSSGDATVGSAGGTRTLTIGNTSSTGAGFINFTTSSAFNNWQIASNQYIQGLSFTPSTAAGGTTYTTPALNILNTGNVGIGTNSPSYKLQVNGSADIINAQGAGANAFYRATSVSAVGDFSWGVDDAAGVGGGNSYIIYDRKNSAYRFVISNAGNVGIGDLTPPAPGGAAARVISLQATQYPQFIYKATSAAANSTAWRTIVRDTLQFQIQTNNDALNTEQNAYEIYRNSGLNTINYHAWYTGSTEAMRLASGNLLLGGITSTYNSAKLSVAGDVEARGNMKSYNGAMGGLAIGGSVDLFTIPAGSFGTAVSMIAYVQQRDDNIGALTNYQYSITGWGGANVTVTTSSSQIYGAGSALTVTTSGAGGAAVVTLTNSSGRVSTSLAVVAIVLIGYGQLTWGF